MIPTDETNVGNIIIARKILIVMRFIQPVFDQISPIHYVDDVS
jgi:hypothetical protein